MCKNIQFIGKVSIVTTVKTEVPMGDLYAQYLGLKYEIDEAISGVISSSSFIRGPDVDAFESEYSELLGVNHCVSCANGTDALYVAMISLGVKSGDEVVVPAMSWISTSETVSQTGAKVVFCDIDPITHTLDPKRLEACITEKTVGVVPVHLYGHPADLDPIVEIAEAHKLWVLEDAAQAHMAKYKSSFVGTLGDAATFSFYPGKNLGAMGDAGAIVTNVDDLSASMMKFARHGGLKKGDHEIEGINSRMDGLQAAILRVKLRSLQSWTQKRQRLAAYYLEELAEIPTATLPTVAPWAEHVWHLFVVQFEEREVVAGKLKERGIASSVNYPVALPFLPCYKRLGHAPSDFPAAYHLSQHGLSLPLFAEMSDKQAEYVVDTLKTLC